MRKLVICYNNDYPPIPDRRMDWSAWVDGTEEDGCYGQGRTKWDAINDLISILMDEED